MLPYDAVIIDEASMVPLPLMSRLASAMRKECRLILLGDRDQLASVEAGAVLGDICGGVREEPFSPAFASLVSEICDGRIPPLPDGEPLPPLADSLVALKRNYRFTPEGGIGGVGTAVREGNGEAALELMKGDFPADVKWRQAPEPAGIKAALASALVEGYGNSLRSSSPQEALAAFDSFRILCAVRKGSYGVETLNTLAEGLLAEKGLIEPGGRWYPGRPVMVTVNDYNLRLFNGDTGIALIDPESAGDIRVFFPVSDGGIRKFSPARLPAHETVYAMTVHKSQGSEFDKVLLILPPTDSGLLTRELVYTAVTRARNGVEIWGDEKIFTAAVGRRIERRSGLKEALWGDL
jgi:exodeoxyribonuclease V alpha subunit